MKLYTKTGDKGKTHVIGGRVDKDDVRVQCYGTVDELNSFIGLALAELGDERFSDIKSELLKIQHELFDCGGDLAYVSPNGEKKLKEEAIAFLEERIDAYCDEAPELEKFILPGGSKAAAYLHVARTVARRAERLAVTLMKTADMRETPLRYLNRLSDYLFAAARVVNFRLDIKDVEYERSATVFKGSGKRKQ
ncbi:MULTISPECIES: cob(I)yrinic acid a,c-diamide adenosyltransferase [Bacillus]|uniref:Corrinoid adenosyltransferase n=1 Tax=Bacillus glycinifermentans TaxID=1664069 RepID=A0AAJ3Z148_9BACI|nr:MULTISPECIES: cob(I)yrinic acid a,c-diamide adenosyltransferase [Bacillus]KKB75427.1 ATP:cob(I)alamin adenosyltransferase [Bacillus sp. TH008]MBU8785511.1 cob(I)yrinic acid a,c-diamide adenosyltransferase [Bacillus glycinifermentans]MDU0070579.1 cob(I)yrinic acid a,c-diamide adenosyltransferase [Bacillus sp. IG6]MED8018443.1 cob(I)yrinic acid a,c-diamide adenosyltransferase [Bacillus glycinifermentans]NUJ15830.1 cob(I)yrinic acid a,c-diamide adenosyltransferase [Bacillus glycinifermentans]